MNPLDLTVSPPRGPYERLDGLLFMPRTIDKMRARLPGGNPGAYFINPQNGVGVSGYLLERIGIREEDLQDVVARAGDDTEIVQWLRERVDRGIFEKINATLERLEICQCPDPAYLRTTYGSLLGPDGDHTRLLDLIEADDRHAFDA